MTVVFGQFFEWDDAKAASNLAKHGVSFVEAVEAFADPQRVILPDLRHSLREQRWYCLGRVGDAILTVRFTRRLGRVRIIGAGYWRKGKELYEAQNQIR
ncbi:MAG: BrnT family toxin [Verrucomicrobiae bacterium]|nr:BrnT family toxin [Verrucomicrobiae bacterium]MDW8307967.1 BrnT family toxin [Verrucomicrobiales bacterium]